MSEFNFPIFLTTRTQEALNPVFTWNVDRQLVAELPKSAIITHIDSNIYTSEFLTLKDQLSTLGESLVLIKDLYYVSGCNFILNSNLELLKKSKSEKAQDANNSIALGEESTYVREYCIRIDNTVGVRPVLTTHKVEISTISTKIVSDKKSFLSKERSSNSVSKEVQVHEAHTAPKKIQYEISQLTEDNIQKIVSDLGFINFCLKAAKIIEDDMKFQELFLSTRIKHSDINISNKEKLLDLTSFSLNDDSSENRMIATCVKFDPLSYEKIYCSFTFANTTNQKQMIFCKLMNKDIITPEQAIFDRVGMTSFYMPDNNVCICGFEDGSLKLYDLISLASLNDAILVSKSPIVYIHSQNSLIITISMDCSIHAWKIKDNILTLQFEAHPKFQALCLHAEAFSNSLYRITDDSGIIYDVKLLDLGFTYLDGVTKYPFPVQFTTEHPFISNCALNGSNRLLIITLNNKEVHRIVQDCCYTCGIFSPTRANIFFALTSDGYFHVFDLLQNDESPIEVKAVNSCRLVGIDVKINGNKQFVAMASQDGSSFILKIPRELCKSYKSDLPEFRSYLFRLESSKKIPNAPAEPTKRKELKYKVADLLK